jgi:predicted enzyme related to lactoylglutathione lyase
MSEREDGPDEDESYFCHIVIPSKDLGRSKIFYEKVFGWRVQEAPIPGTMDVLPPSGKGPSAELNLEEEAVVPAIYTLKMGEKIRLVEEHGGRMLRGRIPIGKDAEFGYYSLFEDPHGNRMALYSRE